MHKHDVITFCFLLLLCLCIFGTALWFVPANGDDLVLLSAVARTHNPLDFLRADWGLQNNLFRPLPSILLWTVYRLVGVVAFPNQVINLGMHVVVIWLLHGLIQRAQPDRLLALLLTSLALCSIYTLSPATWVADRATLFVAISLLVLLRHILPSERGDTPKISLVLVVVTSAMALLSKESGLIVPGIAMVAAARSRLPVGARAKLIIVSVIVIAVYMLVRSQAVQAGADAYVPSGYLWATQHYDNWSALPPLLRVIASVENVLKNLLAPVLPVFGNEGNLLPLADLAGTLLIWGPTLGLIVLSISRHLSRIQMYAWLLLALNAVIHFSIFRYRVLYLAQIAICLFIAFSPRISTQRVVLIKLLAGVLLIYSAFWATRTLSWVALQRYDALYHLHGMVTTGNYPPALDRQVVDQIVNRYAAWLSPK
ncbi:MAG: hypothetical protein M1546_00855 [Chloroflexi bacterium]|nr:hypothetical protein [Chloroflexota bacterium]